MSRPRPRLKCWKSQCRDRDWIYKSLNVETKIKTESLWVSMSRPRPRLNLQKSQCRDWDRDWIFKSLNFETKTETESLRVSMSRPRLRLENLFFLLWNSKNIWVSMSRPRLTLENFFFCYEILFMSRPRLIETRKFCGCRDRDSSRLRNSLVVETETSRDWTKVVETETSSRVSLISDRRAGFGPILDIFWTFFGKN